jgi:hypothetical protein
MSDIALKITTTAAQLQGGLFGQVVLWVFEILPWLRERRMFAPAWNICSHRYGLAPDRQIIPGVFDPLVPPDQGTARKEVNLFTLRRYVCSYLGGDFELAHELWHSYFRVPSRIVNRADDVKLTDNVLGVHYRGTDKTTAAWDTNPVTAEDMLRLVVDFIGHRPALDALFVATDEARFLDLVRSKVDLPVVNVGVGEHHKQAARSLLKADDALLDCLLLSRCRYVVQGSSALSAFAKVLNPSLQSYRVAASKLFAPIPYFPVAYIPRLVSQDAQCQSILNRQMADDWADNGDALANFGQPFGSRPRGFLPSGV